MLPHSCGDLRDNQENPSAGELSCISQAVGTGIQGYRGDGDDAGTGRGTGGYRSVMMWCQD